jgi:hypothetical protein
MSAKDGNQQGTFDFQEAVSTPTTPDNEQRCIQCGVPATRLCDYQIGGAIGGYVRMGPLEKNAFRAILDTTRMPYTCDTPVCEACATLVGAVHLSGKKGWTQTIDHCPLHATKAVRNLLPMTENEVEAERRDIDAYFRRQKMGAV